MKNFVRGANVHISLTFRDHAGSPITPSAANVTLSYVPLSGEGCPDRTFVTFPLAANPEPGTVDWILDWDSSISEPVPVYGHAETVDDPVSAVDFEFRLTANKSNRELAGDTWSSGY